MKLLRLPCPSPNAQTNVDRVGDAIQPSHPLSYPNHRPVLALISDFGSHYSDIASVVHKSYESIFLLRLVKA